MSHDIADIAARLSRVLADETAALKAGDRVDLKANADAKARLLLEMTTPGLAQASAGLSGEQVQALSELIAENAQTLERHIAAVNSIAASLAQEMRDRDDDGTYAAAGRRRA